MRALQHGVDPSLTKAGSALGKCITRFDMTTTTTTDETQPLLPPPDATDAPPLLALSHPTTRHVIKYAIIVSLFLALLVSIQLFITFILLPHASTSILNATSIHIKSMNVTRVTEDGFWLDADMVMEIESNNQWYKRLEHIEMFPMRVEVIDMASSIDEEEENVCGIVDMPKVDMMPTRGGVVSLSLHSWFQVVDANEMEDMILRVVQSDVVTWRLRGTTSVSADLIGWWWLFWKSWTLDSVVIDKLVTIDAMKAFEGSSMTEMALHGRHPAGGIKLDSIVQMANPSNVSMELPLLALHIHMLNGTEVIPTVLCELSQGDVFVSPGINTLELHGRIPAPNSTQDRNVLAKFVGMYLRGQVIPVVAMGAGPVPGILPSWLTGALDRTRIYTTVQRGKKENATEGHGLVNDVEITDMTLDFTGGKNEDDVWKSFVVDVMAGAMRLSFAVPFPNAKMNLTRISVKSILYSVTHGDGIWEVAGEINIPNVTSIRSIRQDANKDVLMLSWNGSERVKIDANVSATTRAGFRNLMSRYISEVSIMVAVTGEMDVGMRFDGLNDGDEIDVKGLRFNNTFPMIGFASVSAKDNMHISEFEWTDIRDGGASVMFHGILQFNNTAKIALVLPNELDVDLFDSSGNLLGEGWIGSDSGRTSIMHGKNALRLRGNFNATAFSFSRVLSSYLDGQISHIRMNGRVSRNAPVSLQPALSQFKLSTVLPRMNQDRVFVASGIFHTFWNPTMTLSLSNPFKRLQLSILTLRATTVYQGGIIISSSDVDLRAVIGSPEGFVLTANSSVESPSIPLAWTEEGKQITKGAVGGELTVDIQLELLVRLGSGRREAQQARHGGVSVDIGSSQVILRFMADLRIGSRVLVQSQPGTLLFSGPTQFAPGKWCGVELDVPMGKNDGSVNGIQYFKCRPAHGVFVRASQLKALPAQPMQAVATPMGMPPGPGQLRAPQTGMRTPPRQPRVLQAPANIRAPQAGAPRVMAPSIMSPVSASSGIHSGIIPPGAHRPSVSGIGRGITPPSGRAPSSSSGSQASSRPGSSHQRQPSVGASSALSGTTGTSMATPGRRTSVVMRPKVRMAIEEPIGPVTTADITPPPMPEEMLRAGSGQSGEFWSDAGSGVGTPEPSSAARSATSATPGGTSSEPMVPLKQYEELRVKLKIMESKRVEERALLKESERTKEEAEQFLHIRTKLAAKLAELQGELREAKKQIKEAHAAKEELEAKNVDLTDSLELAQLDKEMAEERAENLSQEVGLLKEKLDEVKMDLDIYKSSAAASADTVELGEDGLPVPVTGVSAVGLVQLERQNERLKEALMRLRDVSAENEADLQRRVKTLERENFALEALRTQNEKLKEQTTYLEAQVEELKLRLDDALSAEEMTEKLSVENMELKDKLDELKEHISVLEEDKMVSEELEESRAENEKQLQLEIDFKDNVIKEKEKRIEANEETIADYEMTINRFRELVSSLQTDIEQLRSQSEMDKGALHSDALGSQSVAMKDINAQLHSGSLRAQAKQIDLELRKLDAMQSSEQLELVQMYLHDTFFKNEHNALRVYLLFKRIAFKSDLVRKYVDQTRSLPERMKNEDVSEDLLPAFEMRERLHMLSELAQQFVFFMECCSTDTFFKLGSLYEDISGNEKRLNAFLDLLKSECMNEMECLIELDRAVNHLEHLSNLYMEQSKGMLHQQAASSVRQVELSSDRLTSYLMLIKKELTPVPDPSASTPFKFDEDLVSPINEMIDMVSAGRTTCRKLVRRFKDVPMGYVVKVETCGTFKSILALNRKLMKFCDESYLNVKQSMIGHADGVPAAVAASIQKAIYGVTETIFKTGEATLWRGSKDAFAGYYQELARAMDGIEDNGKLEKYELPEAPAVRRSNAFKGDMVMTAEMNKRIQKATEEVHEVIKEVKIKERALQEASLRAELMEKRMESVKKQNEELSVVQEELSKSRQQEKTYETAIQTYVAQIEELEQENAKLKAFAGQAEQQLASKAEMERKMTAFAAASSAQDERVDSATNAQYLIQISALKAAIRYLRAENAELKKKESLEGIFDPISPSTFTKKASAKPKAVREELKSLTLEARALIKDSMSLLSSPRVIDITHHDAKKWQSMKVTPEYQLHSYKSLMHTITLRGKELREQLHKLNASGTPAAMVKLT